MSEKKLWTIEAGNDEDNGDDDNDNLSAYWSVVSPNDGDGVVINVYHAADQKSETRALSRARQLAAKLNQALVGCADELAVHNQLHDWGQQFDGQQQPVPVLTIAGDYVGLAINEIPIWNSESDWEDESIEDSTLTFENAVACYKHQIGELGRWPGRDEGMTDG